MKPQLAPDGKRYVAAELIEVLKQRPESPVEVRVTLQNNVMIGGRLNAVQFDRFHGKWMLAGPEPAGDELVQLADWVAKEFGLADRGKFSYGSEADQIYNELLRRIAEK